MLTTPKDLALKYGFSVSYIRKLIYAGHIKAKKLGRFYAIDTAGLKRLKRKRKTNQPKKDSHNGSYK